MKVRTILYLLSFGILIYLLVESILQLDIAPTKNQHLTNFSKRHVNGIQSLDSAKAEAIDWIDINRENFKLHSNAAKKRIYIIIALLAIQFVMVMLASRNKDSDRTKQQPT